MFKEIAIDPACMAELKYYYLLKKDFGFDKGRYAVADTKTWAKFAFQFANNSSIPTIKKKSVTNFLNKVQKNKCNNIFLLPKCRKSLESNPDWNEWWKKQHEYRQFSASLSTCNKNNFINHDTTLEDPGTWEIPPSTTVLRNNAVDIVRVMETLLFLSEEITLIDPYFRLENQNKTLNQIFKILNTTAVKKFTIVSTMGNRDFLKKTYEKSFKSLNKRLVKLTWVKVPDKSIHDRYLITDKGAIQAGQGWMSGQQKNAPTDDLSVNLVAKEHAKKVKKSIDEIQQSGKASVEVTILEE